MTSLSESITGILREPSIHHMDLWVAWLKCQHPDLKHAEAVREWIWRKMEWHAVTVTQREKEATK